MTADSPMLAFMVRLRKIDNAKLVTRDVLILWAVRATPGMMGRELAMQLGYKSRSNVQEHVKRLCRLGFVEDRRVKLDNRTPNDLYITPAGEALLAEIVPVQ